MHFGPLITILVAGLGFAFIFGAVAHRLGISPLVGFLLAGVVVGPFTPGFVADQELAGQLAEIGVILLMFGVGLHFSLKDLLSVRAIAVPGAVVQIGVATLLGVGVSSWLGWDLFSGLVFGLALSVASTVVLLRALQEHRLVQTETGKIAVGWLIVEDLAMVLALVILPAIAQGLGPGISGPDGTSPSSLLLSNGIWAILALTVLKVAAFVALTLVVGRTVIPRILHWAAHTGSRELFRLAVLGTALGVAFMAASLFGVSFALGAFFAGMILSESQLSQRAAEETLPLRDAFAVLFFVSVGMLFDPRIIVSAPGPLVATLAVILVGKTLAAWTIVRAFGWPNPLALTISASLAQIGEFSFILAGLGVSLGVLPEQGRDLILAGAIFSILLNPLLFGFCVRFAQRHKANDAVMDLAVDPESPTTRTQLSDHVVLVGYGRVGAAIGSGLVGYGEKLLVIESSVAAHAQALADGAEAIFGDAANVGILEAAGLSRARCLFIATPQSSMTVRICEQARKLSPDIRIIARAHSDTDEVALQRSGATAIIVGAHEIARSMVKVHVSGDQFEVFSSAEASSPATRDE